MKRNIAVFLVFLLSFVLTGCAPAAGLPSPPAAEASAPALSTAPSPAPSAAPLPSLSVALSVPSFPEASFYGETEEEGDDGWEEEGDDGWVGGNMIDESTYDSLPYPDIQLSQAEKDQFDPSKVVKHLAASGWYDEYYELSGLVFEDGILYVQVDVIGHIDENDAYKILSQAYHLSDKEIFDLPFFTDYCIHDGTVYQEGEWEAIQNDEDTGEYEEGYLGMPLGVVATPRYPVAVDARIWLVDYDACEHYQVSIDEFRRMYDSGEVSFTEAAFKYANGQITEILEVYIP